MDFGSPGDYPLGIFHARILDGGPFPTPADRPNPDPDIKPAFLHLLHWQAGSLPLAPPGKPMYMYMCLPASLLLLFPRESGVIYVTFSIFPFLLFTAFHNILSVSPNIKDYHMQVCVWVCVCIHSNLYSEKLLGWPGFIWIFHKMLQKNLNKHLASLVTILGKLKVKEHLLK